MLEKQGSFLGVISLDNQAIIPLQTVHSRCSISYPDYEIQVKARQIEQSRKPKRNCAA